MEEGKWKNTNAIQNIVKDVRNIRNKYKKAQKNIHKNVFI
jgi:hypothetical protein